ncbi:MAG: hypothetical protein KDA93_13750 [Planctomycetaceae bacterium]|nr:hypothetical protein [Planctomycetaceae bacterium]
MNLCQKLLHDEHGFIITTELVIIATLLVIGLITGLQCLQTAVVAELKDVGAAIGSLNQSYSYSGMHGCWSYGRSGWHANYTRGSAFVDQVDEYRGNVEIGCYDYGVTSPSYQAPSQPGTVIEQRTIEVAPDAEGVCLPGSTTIQEGIILESEGPCPSSSCDPPCDAATGPILAPQDCPSAVDCPDGGTAH